MKYISVLVFCLATVLQLIAQENFPVNGVASTFNEIHAFINAEIHIDSETSIKRGILLVKDEQILNVGQALTIPENAIIHNLEGAHVYASFIDPYTNYGLSEVKGSKWNPRPQLESNTAGAYSWNQALKPEFNTAEVFVPTSSDAKS